MSPWMLGMAAAKDITDGLKEIRKMGVANALIVILVGSNIGLMWADRGVVVKAVQEHDTKATPAITAIATMPDRFQQLQNRLDSIDRKLDRQARFDLFNCLQRSDNRNEESVCWDIYDGKAIQRR